MKVKFFILSFVVLLTTITVSAQTKITVDAIIDYPVGHIISKLEDSQGNEIDFKTSSPWIWQRLELNNMRLNLAFCINNKVGKVDYIPSIAFGNKAFLIYDIPDDDNIATNYVAWFLQPALDFRIKLLDPIDYESLPTVTIGIGYKHNLMFRKKRGVYGGFFRHYFEYPETVDENIDNVDSGFTLRFGFGVLNNDSRSMTRTSVTFLYEHDLYNFFNQDYTIDNEKPYNGFKTKIGIFQLRITKPLGE